MGNSRLSSLAQALTARFPALVRRASDDSRYRSLFEGAPLALASVSKEGRIEAVNRCFVAEFGYTIEDLPTIAIWWELAYPDPAYRESVQASWAAALDRAAELGTEVEAGEYLVHRKGGDSGTYLIGAKHVDESVIASFVDITERKKVEEALSESLERYRALTECASVGIWQLDGESRSVYTNPAMRGILGFETNEELTGSYYLSYFSPESRERVEAEHTKRSAGFSSTYEAEFLRKDGSRREVIISAAPYKDSRGLFKGTIGTFIDVTEKKRAEALLREAEELSRRRELLLREQNEGLLDLVVNGSLFLGDFDEAVSAITELAVRLGKVGRASVWFYSDDDSSICCSDVFDARTGTHSSGEAIRTADYPWYMAAHRRGEIVAIRDLRSDPRTRDLTAAHCETYSIRSLLDAPVRLGPLVRGLISLETVGAERDWGLEDERLATILATIVSLAFQTAERRRAEEKLRGLNAELERKVDERTEDLAHANLELQAVNVGLAKAMEELKAAQGKILVSEKLAALGRLMAGIAHELNTPLAAIAASSRLELRNLGAGLDEMVLAASRLGPEEREFLREARDRAAIDERRSIKTEPATERFARREAEALLGAAGIDEAEALAEDLVELGIADLAGRAAPLFAGPRGADLMTLLRSALGSYRAAQIAEDAVGKASRVVSALRTYARGGEEEVPTKLRLAPEIRGLLDLYYNRTKRGIEIALDIDESFEVRGRREGLNRIWFNILNNAVQAVGEKGRIEVSATREGDSALVSIADSGPGIPERFQGRIFEPFFSTKPAGEGTGLGLDIARRLARDNGGDISFESRPGRTVFTVRLPLGAS